MPSSAVASASPSLFIGCRRCSPRLRAADFPGVPLAALAAVVGYAVFGCCVGLAVAFIGCRLCLPQFRLCRSVLCCVARCCRWCRRHAVALIGLCRYSHCSCACHRSAWRATRCFPWCRQLAVALISCCRSSTHSLAVRCSAQRAAYCSRCRCRLCRPCLSRRPRRCSHRLSPLLNSTHSLAFSRSSWFAARSLAAVVGYASSSPSLSSAVAIACITRSCAAALRCVPLAALAVVLC